MFWKKEKEEKPIEKKVDDSFERLKKFRDIGEKFKYLGVEMTVIGYTQLYPSPYYTTIVPCLRVNYVTKQGVIESGIFYEKDIPIIIKENPELANQPNI